MGTETPQRPRKEAAGSRHEPGLVRQTAPASTDPIGPLNRPGFLRELVN